MGEELVTKARSAARRRFSPELEQLCRTVVDAAFHVHQTLGPGLLESVYEACLATELKHRGIRFARQVGIDIKYRDVDIESGLRLDFLVDNVLVLELKAIEGLLPVHRAQLASYLRLSNRPLGFLINFNVEYIRDGIKRVANPSYEGPLRLS